VYIIQYDRKETSRRLNSTTYVPNSKMNNDVAWAHKNTRTPQIKFSPTVLV